MPAILRVFKGEMKMEALEEYRNLKPEDMAVRTELAKAPGAFKSTYRVIYQTIGYERAGSCARYCAVETWGCTGEGRNGTTFGQWYKTEAEARAHFERVTTPICEATV